MNRLCYLFIFILLSVLLSSAESIACTVFHTTDNNGNVLAGRNFDWEKTGGKIWFIPGTEESNSITVFTQAGADMPYEGINSKGLFVAIAAVPDTKTPLSLFKPMRKSLEMVRVLLEQTDNVDDAIKIFPKYTVVFGKFLGNPPIHYKLTDANDNSAIIEYIDNKIVVTKDAALSRVMTNHYNARPDLGPENKSSFERYGKVNNELKNQNHSIEDVRRILKTVSQNTTVWSNIYDLNNQKIYISYKNSETIALDLKEEIYLGKHCYNLEDLSKKDPLKFTEKKSNVFFRPHSGYGFTDGNGVFHYGGRVLLPAGDIRKYGIEITEFSTNDKRFTLLGIVLEQRLFNWLNMSIGTVGYFKYGPNLDNVAGITTNIGWEPNNHIPFKPFVTYRSDVLFAGHTKIFNSCSIGFAVEF